jgi:molybdopterin-guanine dinucleotide biosynthesis protein A
MTAVLLAGGSGRRAGGPKAHIPVDGTPLWRLVAERLQEAVTRVVVAVGPDPWDTGPFASVTDAGRGPLDGIAAAFDGHGLIVWTVDVPDVIPDEVSLLRSPSPDVRHLVDADGRAQPLLARWPAEVVAAIPAYLDAGGRSVLGFLDDLPLEAVGPPRDRAHLTTPQDVERWLGSV